MKFISLAFLFALLYAPDCQVAYSQPRPAPTASPRPAGTAPIQQRTATPFELTEYGVSVRAEPRLIIMMAALEASGFDAMSSGMEPTAFRAQVRRDLADLDPDLRNRLRAFYERHKLPSPATAADQAARYVSLALALAPAPSLDAPPRSEELPASLLEVLDFAPLVQEFYRRANINERLPSYTRAYEAEGDRLRKPTAEMVRSVLSYLHTRPITVSIERIPVKAPAGGKKTPAAKTYTIREHERHFVILPDLLGAAGAIQFRVIGDEYYAVVPDGTDPSSSELRRGYLQYVIDPLMLRFNREIAARRDQIKQVLAASEKTGNTVSPDIFLAVSRSMVAAADERFEEVKKLDSLSILTRERLAKATDDATRQTITREFQAATNAIHDETVARLAEHYERGAVLAFFFVEQLKGVESSGFDVANFFVDMISSFDPARETRRLNENAEARQRALSARQARLNARMTDVATPVYSDVETTRAALLVRKLGEIEQVLRLKDYNNAEAQLKELLREYSREPRIFFALAQTASIAAADATDENVQAERLNRALANYRFSLEASSPETDRALISRAHEAMGRIYAFLGNTDEALKAFDMAIAIGEVTGGAHEQAKEGKKKLNTPQ
jgi:tetratricopeptide (TPR) repeat protein